MKLYVMRHGPAEDHATSGRDFDRALTEQGRERVRLVARALREKGEAPKRIVSSPLVRAVQTAEIVAAEVEVETVEIDASLEPGGNSPAYARIQMEKGGKRLMVVGHEPDLSHAVAALLGRSFTDDMLKAMVVGLSLRENTTLRFILDPKSLVFR